MTCTAQTANSAFPPTALLVAIVALHVALAGAACDTAKEPPIPVAEMRTLTGVLRSDAGAPTGWVVEETGTNVAQAVDVQLVIEEAQRMSGSEVSIRGNMEERAATDGTRHPVFVARAIDAVRR